MTNKASSTDISSALDVFDSQKHLKSMVSCDRSTPSERTPRFGKFNTSANVPAIALGQHPVRWRAPAEGRFAGGCAPKKVPPDKYFVLVSTLVWC